MKNKILFQRDQMSLRLRNELISSKLPRISFILTNFTENAWYRQTENGLLIGQ